MSGRRAMAGAGAVLLLVLVQQAGWCGLARPGSHSDEPPPVRVKLHLPPKLPGGAARMSMALQVGENRVYRFQEQAPGATLDLGLVERGWNTFRFFNVHFTRRGQPVPEKAGITCSGGFAAEHDAEFQVVLEQDARGLHCSVR